MAAEAISRVSMTAMTSSGMLVAGAGQERSCDCAVLEAVKPQQPLRDLDFLWVGKLFFVFFQKEPAAATQGASVVALGISGPLACWRRGLRDARVGVFRTRELLFMFSAIRNGNGGEVRPGR